MESLQASWRLGAHSPEGIVDTSIDPAIGSQINCDEMKWQLVAAIVSVALLNPSNVFAAVEQEAVGARSNDNAQVAQVLTSSSFDLAFPPLGRGTTVDGRIEAAGSLPADVDCFGFHVDTKDSISLHVVSKPPQTPDSLLVLHTPDGAIAAESDDDGIGFTSALTYDADTSGTWSACLRAFQSIASFDYTLIVSASESPAGPGSGEISEGAANNDTVAAAEPFLSGSGDLSVGAPGLVAVKRGELSNAADVDVYSLQIPKSSWVSIAVYDDSSGLRDDLELKVTTSSGSAVEGEDQGPGFQPSALLRNPTGPLFVEVRTAQRNAQVQWLGVPQPGTQRYRVVASLGRAPATGCGLLGPEAVVLIVLLSGVRRLRSRVKSVCSWCVCAGLLVSAPGGASAQELNGAEVAQYLLEGGARFERSGGLSCIGPRWDVAGQRVVDSQLRQCSPRWLEWFDGEILIGRGQPHVSPGQVDETIGRVYMTVVLRAQSPSGNLNKEWMHDFYSDDPRSLFELVNERCDSIVVSGDYRCVYVGLADDSIRLPVILFDGREKADPDGCWGTVRRYRVKIGMAAR